MRPDIGERIGRPVSEHLAAVVRDKLIESSGRRETKLHTRMCENEIHHLRNRTRGNHEFGLAADPERQQSALGRLQELVVIERTGFARALLEGLVAKAEPVRQRIKIAVLADDAGRDQHPFGGDPDCIGAMLRIGHDRSRQPVTYAVDFRESAPRPVFCRRSVRWCHRGGNDLAPARVAVSPMDRTAGRDRALAVHHNATPNTPILRKGADPAVRLVYKRVGYSV